jgi:hypothetical protein
MACAALLPAQTSPDAGSSFASEVQVNAPNPLPGLPHPPDRPASLYAPPPPQPYSQQDPMPPHYFEPDPLLDPPWLPPGWFTSVDATIAFAHVKNKLQNQFTVDGRPPDTVLLPMATLDISLMPRFQAGYRLPSGFGELALSYRFLATSGNEPISSRLTGLNSAGNLRSRLDFNVFDFDYASREFSLYPQASMKWRVGARLAYVYWDSEAVQSAALALTDNGILSQHVTNSYVGAGLHTGLELAYAIPCCSLAVVGRSEFSDLLGRIRQGFFEQTFPLGAGGLPASGQLHDSSSQDVPTLASQLGLAWYSRDCCRVRLFGGYEYEYWWSIGRLSKTLSRGEMYNQGVVLQAQIDF